MRTKIYDPRHAAPGCAVVIVAAIAIGVFVAAVLAQHTGGAHAAVIQSWASVRHHMCVIQRTYFLHHAHGSFHCFWSRVNARKWIETGIANLTRP